MAALSAIKGGSRNSKDVLRVWFGDYEGNSPVAASNLSERYPLWYNGGKEFDDVLKEHGVVQLVDEALQGSLHEEWARDRWSSLALILCLDQFTRNVYRGTSRAFAGDEAAVKLSKAAISAGWLSGPPEVYNFFLLPLEHSESLDDHELLHQTYASSGTTGELTKFATEHTDILHQFGRYPHRNQVLGRSSTPEELEYLKNAERFGQ